MKRLIIKEFRTPADMARFAARLLKGALRDKRAGPLLAALPGGRTPVLFLKSLTELKADWTRAHFFMTDERLTPFSSPASNFGQARRLLFSKIKIPPANLHPVRFVGPARTSGAYEEDIKNTAGTSAGFDIIYLGLGKDGHIASLFPDSPALLENTRLVCAARAPAGVKPSSRITLTLKTLNSSNTIVLMASGPSKKTAFLRTVAGDKRIPAARLRPRGDLYLLFSKE